MDFLFLFLKNILSLLGPGKSESDAASIRANNFIPLQCGLFYFEITIVNKGRDGYLEFKLNLSHLDTLGLEYVRKTCRSIGYLDGKCVLTDITETTAIFFAERETESRLVRHTRQVTLWVAALISLTKLFSTQRMECLFVSSFYIAVFA